MAGGLPEPQYGTDGAFVWITFKRPNSVTNSITALLLTQTLRKNCQTSKKRFWHSALFQEVICSTHYKPPVKEYQYKWASILISQKLENKNPCSSLSHTDFSFLIIVVSYFPPQI